MPLMFIGRAECFVGRVESAIDYFRQAVEEIGDDNETLNLFFGMALRDAGQFGAALDNFERMIAQDPGNAWPVDLAAQCVFKTGGRVKGQSYARTGWRSVQGVIYGEWRAGDI